MIAHSSPADASETGVSLETIARELGGDLAHASSRPRVVGDASVRIRDVQQDSRKVVAGDLFVSRAGSGDAETMRARMQKNLVDAVDRGASAILRAYEDRDLVALNVPSIEVRGDRLRAAIGVAASAAHGHPSFALDVLAVTGTNGKTTVTSLLGDALTTIGKSQDVNAPASCAVIGTVEARLGDERHATSHTTPEGDELARLLSWAQTRGAKYVAMEASSHALDQERLAGTRVRAAAFTNLTQDHLDYHATMEAYFDAKSRLFRDLNPGFAAIVVDDEYGARLAEDASVPKLRVSSRVGFEGADVRVVSARFDARGVVAEIATPSGRTTLQSALVGAHNLSNLLVALAVLLGLDLPLQESVDALSTSRGARGRLELASDPRVDDVVVLVDYAHTPDALVRVLAALRAIATSRILCVFGCGGDRDPTKRAPMGRAVVEGADLAIVTSDNPRTEDPHAIVDAIVAATVGSPRVALDGIAAASNGVAVEVDRARAIAASIAGARPGDIVLIAGKGHEEYQIVGTEKRSFDDVVEAKRCLTARRSASAIERGRG